MSDFESEFEKALMEELGASERDARRIAQKAAKFRCETETETTAEGLIERMEKRSHEDQVDKWNTVVGFLHASTWSVGDENGSENPYQL